MRDKNSAEKLELLREANKELMSTPSALRTGKKLHYVRYAENWVVGVQGTKEDAYMLKEKIAVYLKTELAIELNQEKTKVTHIKDEPAYFLGFKIKATDPKYYESRIATVEKADHTDRTYKKRAPHGTIKLYVDFERIVDRLVEKGFVNKELYRGKCYGP